MIVEGMMSLVLSIVQGILSLIPDIDWSIPPNVFASAVQYLGVAFYVLPMGTVFTICSLLVVLQMFRIAVSLIKTIWALLPLV